MKRYSQLAFTIPEVLIATVIMLMVMGALLMVYLTSYANWREGSAQIMLQRKASIAMEKMFRGVTGQNGIREAASVNLESSTAIEFTSGIDLIERKFYLDGTELMYDPDTSTDDDDYSICDYVSVLEFVMPSTRTVSINLTLEDEVGSKVITVNLQSDVTLRN